MTPMGGESQRAADPGLRTVGEVPPASARSVLLIDDHPRFRAEVRALLELDGLVVVGEAGDAATALAATERLRPDVVLLDVGLPDGDGLDLVRRFRDRAPGSLVLAISSRAEAEYGDRVIGSGVDAFVDKADLAPGVIAGVIARLGRT